MRSLFVVFLPPALDDEPSFPNRDEDPAVEAAIPKHAVERLDIVVLPGTARVDELCGDPALRDPFLDSLADDLWAVVALDDSRNPSALDQVLENTDDVVRVQELSRLDPDRFPGEIIDHRQEPKPSFVS